MSPYESDDLTETAELREDELVFLRSPDTAEHDPDYQEVARLPLRKSYLTGGRGT
jgi:hypothetical protein